MACVHVPAGWFLAVFFFLFFFFFDLVHVDEGSRPELELFVYEKLSLLLLLEKMFGEELET